MSSKYKFILKGEYRATPALRKEIRKIQDIFFIDNHKFLRTGTQLPKNVKKRIDDLWWTLPISRIQHGFKTYALVEIELEDLKRDPFCGKNSNKIWWIKTYMMDWFCNLPETCNTEMLFSILMGRKANRLLILNAYQKVEDKNV